jgi:uncharacterized protein (DUF1800 family)
VTPREQIAWLYRRVGFGLAPGQLDELEALGVDRVLDLVVDPDAHGVEPNPDPWARLSLTGDQSALRQEGRAAVAAWIAHLGTAPRPLEEWIRWFWHGHLVSALSGVKSPLAMVRQLRMYGALGLGPFRELLRATTIDAAMLLYLNGAESVGTAPNENYAREVLELFALGVGAYTETDVAAAAAALTGWTVRRPTYEVVFRPGRHDDTRQSFLATEGVHDVDTVMDAIVDHERCAPWVASELAHAILGSGVDDGVVDRLARSFADNGLEIRPLVRRILEEGLDGAARPMTLAPVPWLAGAVRATGSSVGGVSRDIGRGLQAAGQLPMAPPNVSGWSGNSWLGSSTTVARFNLSGLVAEATPPSSQPRQLAADGDVGRLADALGHPEGFGDASSNAIRDARRLGGPPGVAPLTIALASPELVQA